MLAAQVRGAEGGSGPRREVSGWERGLPLKCNAKWGKGSLHHGWACEDERRGPGRVRWERAGRRSLGREASPWATEGREGREAITAPAELVFQNLDGSIMADTQCVGTCIAGKYGEMAMIRNVLSLPRLSANPNIRAGA
ncbi:neuroplastin [Platysternon megacephalum]|uniref:Neuroplastin n=1 Tax=Platysternon megacephalum TaxID=55544 RepID=A0A4D9E0R0_9SAUR|nr:neuroplastin [Platysternon megacephalum]